MNQLCKVCGEPAAGFHFGAFTCEGCKSFFGRTYNNIAAIAGCKNSGDCVINKKNRTACKACRLRKCLLVGMSKSGSRYGRRSNWFKIHCLLQEQQSQSQSQQHQSQSDGSSSGTGTSSFEQLARLHQMQVRQTYQDKTNPCIKTAVGACSPTMLHLAAFAQPPRQQQQQHPVHSSTTTATATTTATITTASGMGDESLFCRAKFLNGVVAIDRQTPVESRFSGADTPSDSGASSTGEPPDRGIKGDADAHCERNCASAHQPALVNEDSDDRERRRQQLLEIFRSHSEPLRPPPFMPFATAVSNLAPSLLFPPPPSVTHTLLLAPPVIMNDDDSPPQPPPLIVGQDEPIDLSFKSLQRHSSHRRTTGTRSSDSSASPSPPTTPNKDVPDLRNVLTKPTPLDLTLMRAPQTLTG